MSSGKRYWFATKPYGNGWGWGPPFSWQGWVVFIVFLALVVAGALLIPPRSWLVFFFYIVAIATGFISICMWKGEPQQATPSPRDNSP